MECLPVIRKMTLLFLFAFTFACPSLVFAEKTAEYKADVSDILNVAVLQPDKLEMELTVSPDGTVTFPYIGSVEVKGLTMMEIQDKIQRGLTDYMKYPLVSVSLKASRSRIYYVYGEVNRPGSYALEKDMTIMQALITAGGFTRMAAMDNVKILRKKPDGSPGTTLSVNANNIMNGKQASDIPVEPGDVITVAKTFF